MSKKLRREAPASESKAAYTDRAVKLIKSITSEACQNYIQKMPDKIADCVAKGGQIGRS